MLGACNPDCIAEIPAPTVLAPAPPVLLFAAIACCSAGLNPATCIAGNDTG